MVERLERLSPRFERLADLFDLPRPEKAQLLAGAHRQVTDLLWIELHQPAAGRVDRHQIATHDEQTHWFRGAVQRTVALHANDAVDNGQFRRPRQGDVDDAVVD